MKKFSRRRFIATSSTGLLASQIPLATADASLPELKEDEPIAMALGYKADAADVDTSRFPKRAGEQGATQFCDNCALYKDVGNGLGTCTAIRGKLVAGKGWCNAWVPAS